MHLDHPALSVTIQLTVHLSNCKQLVQRGSGAVLTYSVYDVLVDKTLLQCGAKFGARAIGNVQCHNV